MSLTGMSAVEQQIRNMQNLSIHPIVNPWLVMLAVVVLIGMVFIQPRHVRLKPTQTTTLVVLRLLVVLMTLLVMLRPTWIYSELRPQKSSLVVLVDDSAACRWPIRLPALLVTWRQKRS